jgi:hypothetical protein
MLAEIFMLRLETAFRKNVDAPWCSSGDKRFAPVKLPISHQPTTLVDREINVG